jgi:pimeloyl-ACP methyl ester carboxylesterase
MGGYVALALLALAPARVSGLALANTRATADAPEGRAARDRMIALAQREGPSAIAREMVPKLLGATTLREQADLAETVGHMIQMNTAEAIVAAVRAIRDRPDRTPLLASRASVLRERRGRRCFPQFGGLWCQRWPVGKTDSRCRFSSLRGKTLAPWIFNC